VPGEEVPAESYISLSDSTQIRVSRLDPRRKVPSEAEDLGDGFFKDNADYYLKTETVNYKFILKGQDLDLATEIVLSAKQVTVPVETE
jgi:hypothetical protein